MNQRLDIYCLFIIILIFSFKASSQTYTNTVIKLGPELGLNGQFKTIYHLDQFGYFWMASQYGLDRYDGKEVLNVEGLDKFNQNNTNVKIFESRDSMIWFIYGNASKVDNVLTDDIDHIYWLDPTTCKKIPQEKLFPQGLPFSIASIKSISRTGMDLYFATYEHELFHYDTSFHKIADTGDLLLSSRHWLVNRKGNFVNIEGDKFSEYAITDGTLIHQKSISTKTANLYQDNLAQYQLFVNDADGNIGYIYSEDFELIDSLPLQKMGVPFLQQRADGNYCRVTSQSINIVNEQKRNLVDIPKLIGINKKDFNQQVEFPYQPEYADFVFVQTGTMPFIVYSFISPFENFLVRKESPFSTRGIATAPNGDILVNSRKGFHHIHADSNIEELFSTTDLNLDTSPIASITNFYDSVTQSFWIVHVNMVVKYNPVDGSLSSYTGSRYPNNRFKRIKRIGERLILTSKEGLHEINDSCKCIRKLDIEQHSHPVNTLEIEKLQSFENNHFLITPAMIYEWDLEANQLKDLYSIPEAIAGFKILDYYFPNKNEVWLATSGLGLVHWSFASGELEFYRREQGLSSDVAYSVQPDADGKLWIPTAWGLNSFDIRTKEFTSYFPEDGLPHYEFNSLSFHQDENGLLYFGGLNGITRFDPKQIGLLQSHDPPTYIVDVNIISPQDSAYTNIEDIGTQPIKLKTKETLRVSFSSPNVVNAKPILYQYKFEGENVNWQNHNGSTLSFSNLGLGSHRLKIRGPGIHKKWSSEEAILDIEVPTPFFQSRWFYLSLITVLMLSGYIYARWRIYNLEKTKIKLANEVEKRTLKIKKSKELIEHQATELRQLDALKSRFFTNISHELRTPLTLIINPLLELKKSKSFTDLQNSFLDTAYSGSQQLKKMIDKILKLSELDAQKIKLKESPISITRIAEEMIFPYKSSAESLGLNFVLKIADTVHGDLLIDNEKLREIIENIIVNAIKFSSQGGSIRIELKYENDHLIFICQDAGVGLNELEKEKIFTRYYQVADLELPAQGGLGIGLPLAREYTRLMKGELTVNSKNGQGSTFMLNIPAVQVESSSTNGITNVQSGQPDLKNKEGIHDHKLPTLLIIEDHNLMNVLLSNILNTAYNVVTAENGQMGLTLLKDKKNSIDLIITDWMMPIMDGPTFLTHLRADPKYRSIPCIMLTARATQLDKLEALKIGVDDYIIKPFDPVELKIRINNLLENSENRKQELTKNTEQSKPVFKTALSVNDQWLEELEKQTVKSLGTTNIAVIDLAKAMNISERQLSRKLKSLTGLTPGNYIKEFRLLKARHLLENKQMHTVAEVSYAVGFSTPDYFSKIYFERFGKLPSAY